MSQNNHNQNNNTLSNVPSSKSPSINKLFTSLQPQAKKPSKKYIQQMSFQSAVQNCRLLYDRHSNTYIEISIRNTPKIVRINSIEFRRWLTHNLMKTGSEMPVKQILDTFVLYLEQEALEAGTEAGLFNRLGYNNGKIYLYLNDANNTVVEITNQGWKLTHKAPVLFETFAHQAALPIPQPGGNLIDILPLTNLKNQNQKILVLAWLISSYFTDIPRAFLWITGKKGSAKTTLANLLQSLIDPTDGKTINLSHKEEEMAQIFDHHSVPILDNVTKMPGKVSDLLCRNYSGGNYSKRSLYTNDGDFIFNLRCNPIFTSIRLPNIRLDLLDRLYMITLTEIVYSDLREEREIMTMFNKLQPKLLGGLLDVVSKTMQIIPTIEAPHMSRTIDFDKVSMAATNALGSDNQAFFRARRSSLEITSKAAISHPAIKLLVSFMIEYMSVNETNQWTGYMKDLLQHLASYSNDSQDLPKAENHLSKIISDHDENLKGAGFFVKRAPYTDAKGRHYKIFRQENDDPISKGFSQSKLDVKSGVESIMTGSESEVKEDEPKTYDNPELASEMRAEQERF